MLLQVFFRFTTNLNINQNSRIHSNKVFKRLAQRGKDSVGWFYGFKLHIVINEKEEIFPFDLIAGNVDDRKSLKNDKRLEW